MLLTVGAGMSTVKAEEVASFDIAVQSAAKGLNLYAEQAGQQLLFPYDEIDGVHTESKYGKTRFHRTGSAGTDGAGA